MMNIIKYTNFKLTLSKNKTRIKKYCWLQKKSTIYSYKWLKRIKINVSKDAVIIFENE